MKRMFAHAQPKRSTNYERNSPYGSSLHGRQQVRIVQAETGRAGSSVAGSTSAKLPCEHFTSRLALQMAPHTVRTATWIWACASRQLRHALGTTSIYVQR